MTRKSKLPSIPVPSNVDPAVRKWMQFVAERLEVREGSRGDPLEKVVTFRDLVDIGVSTQKGGSGLKPGDIAVVGANGDVVSISLTAFSEKIRNTSLFKDLQRKIDDPDRFSSLAEELRSALELSIADEAARRQADIQRRDIKIQELDKSLAASVTELTAALNGNAAGIREVQYAYVTADAAQAGQITQLEARLEVPVNEEDLLPVPPASAYATLSALQSAVPAATADTRKYYRVTNPAGGDDLLYRSDGSAYSLVGTLLSAKLEEVLKVTADKALGLESQYTIKVTAGNSVAGFGIAATERDGVPESSFIVQADAFAVVPPVNFSQSTTPSATAVGQIWYNTSNSTWYRATTTGTGGWVVYTYLTPLGVDTVNNTTYVNGTLRVNSGTGSSLSTVSTQAASGAAAATNFNARNDRNSAAIITPTIATNGTAVDHTINTDGSADISFEWGWSGTESDIDGFILYLRQSSSSSAYTFGTTPAEELTFTFPAEKRAFLAYGLPANKYYTFGIQAYRVVDPDVNAAGIIKSTLVKATGGGENPYQPSSSVAFAGNVSGTVSGSLSNASGTFAGTASGTVTGNLSNASGTFIGTSAGTVTGTLSNAGGTFTGTASGTVTGNVTGTLNGSSVATVVSNASNGAAAATNFNARNDRNSATIVAPTIATDGTAIDHTINTDGSADISFEWSWGGTESDIDGFIVYGRQSTSSSAYTFGTTPAEEMTYTVPANKRALIAYGVPANKYYTIGVQAYRVVDPDVNAAGIIKSTLVKATGSGENPYQPSSSVAFAGDVSGTVSGSLSSAGGTFTGTASGTLSGNVTGTVDGTAANTVVSWASNGDSAYSAVYDGTTGLATKMGVTVKNALSGQGGIKVGTIDWNTSGTVVSGSGVAITAAGIVGRSGSTNTFAIDSSGNASFAGDISAASGTFAGNVVTSGQLKSTGAVSAGSYTGAVAGETSTASNRAVLGVHNGSGIGVQGYSASGYGVYASNSSSSYPALEVYNTTGGNVPVAAFLGAGTVQFNNNRLQKAQVNGQLIKVYDTSTHALVGTYEYSFE